MPWQTHGEVSTMLNSKRPETYERAKGNDFSGTDIDAAAATTA